MSEENKVIRWKSLDRRCY